MTEQELLNKLNDLSTINGIQVSRIRTLEEEVKKMHENANHWHEAYENLLKCGKKDDSPGYGNPAPAPKISTFHNSVKILGQSSV